MLIMAYDGDNAGRLVGRAILANDAQGLSEASQRIDLGHEIVTRWVAEMGGTRISGGGDEGTFQVPPQAMDHIEELRKDYQFATGLTMTVGVGQDLSQAGKSLMVGKLRGKDQVVNYDDSVEQDYALAQSSLGADDASAEQKKLGEAYMTPEQKSDDVQTTTDQPAPADDHHDCPYCAEMDGADGHACGDDCPYCKEYDAKQAEGNSEEHDHDNCPYCKEYDERGGADSCDCPHCAEYDAKVAAGQDPTAVGSAEGSEQDDPETAQAMQNILQHFDQEAPVDPMSDDAALPVNGQALPGDQENVPADMGLSEEDQGQGPDLTQVLQGGLDQHADQIAREKVVGMVSEALDGFKQSKDILERAKEQAPQLYQASIMMLKAMIEMAKMLGLGPSEETPADPTEQPGQQAETPAAPPAAAQEDAAESPQQ
jgi:hypothetical protein